MNARFAIPGLFLLACAPLAHGAAVTFSASGSATTDIQTTVDAFRIALGTLNANVAGSFGSGRREINWDGVPDARAAPNLLPADFFNVNSPRGVVFSTPGTGFEVSANAANPTSTPIEFGDLNATYTAEFQTFSAQRLFTAIGSDVTDVNFFVSGSTTPAFTSAFGAVFTDVDLASLTSLQFFDSNNVSLGTFFAPTANNGLSFLGIAFNAGERISRVRITAGNAALGPSETGALDLVVMDDFLYAEPAARVPEPATLALLALGLAGIGAFHRRRAR